MQQGHSNGCSSDLHHRNPFGFVGNHKYYPVITWLDRIGERNRDCLSSMEIQVDSPRRTWQMPDGTRLNGNDPHYQCFSPRHPHFVDPIQPWPECEVDVTGPAIETIIPFFAGSSGVTELKLILKVIRDLRLSQELRGFNATYLTGWTYLI